MTKLTEEYGFNCYWGGVTGHKAFAENCGAICKPQDAVDVISALVRVYIRNGNHYWPREKHD